MNVNKKIRVLIVEDEQDIRDIYALKFEKEGFKVQTAGNGEAAMAIIESNIFDIILLDVIMPKLDGFEVLRRLKDSEKTKNIPVFLLSNLSQEAEINQGLKLKADKYLIKADFTPEEVVIKVREFLQKKT